MAIFLSIYHKILFFIGRILALAGQITPFHFYPTFAIILQREQIQKTHTRRRYRFTVPQISISIFKLDHTSFRINKIVAHPLFVSSKFLGRIPAILARELSPFPLLSIPLSATLYDSTLQEARSASAGRTIRTSTSRNVS